LSKVVTIGNATLYLGDCLEILPTLKADAVVTDPPYGISHAPQKGSARVGKRVGKSNDWHAESTWDKEIKSEWCAAISKVAPIVAWFGHWRMRRQIEEAMSLQLRGEIVWAKDCHVGPPAPTAPRDERIWLFSDSGIKPTRFETSVWDDPIIPTWSQKHHVNEKPVRLMSRLVSWLDAPTVLDPFMGSGTTGVACVNVGRAFVGVEIDPKHFETACERIEAAHAQGRLFA
jgi:site-specific DNA-methyltransferase (adenine-specific)